MNHPSNAAPDPRKKYWWLILVVVPIVLALIALIPTLIKDEQAKHSAKTSAPIKNQQAENVGQTTEKGHNFTNVQGDINITESDGKDENTP